MQTVQNDLLLSFLLLMLVIHAALVLPAAGALSLEMLLGLVPARACVCLRAGVCCLRVPGMLSSCLCCLA
jgi:hypothetical protein